MSDSQDSDIYHSPPQTPQPCEHGVDSDQESLDSQSTARRSISRSPVVLSSSETLHRIIMSNDQSSSQDTSSVPSIPNLNDDNWGTWHSAMDSYFMIKDLDGILDETETAPPSSDTLATRAFLKRQKHVAGIIGLKLSDSIRELLVNDNNRRDPVALWRDIKSHFASTKARNRGRVFSKLFSLSCIGNDISEFINSAKKTLNELSAIGVQTDSEMIAHFLLHLLPLGFDTFKDMVIHTAEVTDTPLSVNSVINLLQQHVNNKKVQLSNPTSSTALSVQNFAQNAPSKNGPVGRFKQPICRDGKHNPATQHAPERCWQLHPELRTPQSTSSANLITTNVPTSTTSQPSPPAMTTFLLAAFNKTTDKVESI